MVASIISFKTLIKTVLIFIAGSPVIRLVQKSGVLRQPTVYNTGGNSMRMMVVRLMMNF